MVFRVLILYRTDKMDYLEQSPSRPSVVSICDPRTLVHIGIRQASLMHVHYEALNPVPDSWGSQIFLSSEYCGYLVVNPTYSAVAATYSEFQRTGITSQDAYGDSAMIFDLFLLILAIHGLSRSSSSISLRTTLHNPSVISFFIVFLATVVPLVCSSRSSTYFSH